eukprot:COSAG02_NODE_1080_length_14710_cov_46.078913_19_plen_176_part_01
MYTHVPRIALCREAAREAGAAARARRTHSDPRACPPLPAGELLRALMLPGSRLGVTHEPGRSMALPLRFRLQFEAALVPPELTRCMYVLYLLALSVHSTSCCVRAQTVFRASVELCTRCSQSIPQSLQKHSVSESMEGGGGGGGGERAAGTNKPQKQGQAAGVFPNSSLGGGGGPR